MMLKGSSRLLWAILRPILGNLVRGGISNDLVPDLNNSLSLQNIWCEQVGRCLYQWKYEI